MSSKFKTILKWLDLKFTLPDLFFFTVLTTLGLTFFRTIEPAYRSIIFWPLIAGVLLIARIGIFSLITAIVGALGSGYYAYKYEIAWEQTAPQFDDCLAAHALIGATALLSVHSLFRLRWFLAILGLVAAWHGRNLFYEVYGENSWFIGW